MADQTMRDELHDVKQHAKEAMRSTLMAMRTAVDFALNKLDGEDDAGTGASNAAPTNAERAHDDAPPEPDEAHRD